MQEHGRNRKKILLVSPFPVFRGGIQLFLLSLTQSLLKENDSFTWYCKGITDGSLAKEFEVAGVRILAEMPAELGFGKLKGRFRFLKQLYRLCREEKFDIIHIHTSDLRFQAEALLTAKYAGVRQRIAHGHFVPYEKRRLRCALLRPVIRHAATGIAACSRLAAEYMCGQGHRDDAMIFTNCIDTKRFAFSAARRAACRNRLGLADALVIGHIGSFTDYKNHRFLIEVFRAVADRNRRAALLLVGGGELLGQIKEQAASCGLSDRVIFVGISDKVEEYLCAMDIFVLPSLAEGLPLVSLEAQAAGLPCLVSEAVPPEAKVLEDVTVLPLQEGAEAWAKKILSAKPRGERARADAWRAVRDAGCDIREVKRYAEKLYGTDHCGK